MPKKKTTILAFVQSHKQFNVHYHLTVEHLYVLAVQLWFELYQKFDHLTNQLDVFNTSLSILVFRYALGMSITATTCSSSTWIVQVNSTLSITTVWNMLPPFAVVSHRYCSTLFIL